MVSGQRLSDVFRAVGPLYREAAQRVARDEQLEGVSTGVRAVLVELLAEGRQTMPAVARNLGTTRQYVQRMVEEAAAAGLVRSVPNPAHRRSPLLALTPAGRAAIRRILRREQAALAGAARDLSDRDVDACLRVLHRLRQAVREGG